MVWGTLMYGAFPVFRAGFGLIFAPVPVPEGPAPAPAAQTDAVPLILVHIILPSVLIIASCACEVAPAADPAGLTARTTDDAPILFPVRE